MRKIRRGRGSIKSIQELTSLDVRFVAARKNRHRRVNEHRRTVFDLLRRVLRPSGSAFVISIGVARSLHPYLWFDRHSGAEQVLWVLALVEHDLDGDSLHDLDVISRGILGRQQTVA
jgi:hypothetical protein